MNVTDLWNLSVQDAAEDTETWTGSMISFFHC
jgi:hypothetical protein